ncbi:MAG: 4-hydroxybutyrate--acetyl-CoA CoA transferase, partial [Deltaproteobacteria bacterium]|nr:4-hydroxybutyrate--acetyl-CoA CoA transferase [Deltaproteobacteria bacterium]
MNAYQTELKEKLTTPQDAVQKISDGDLIVHGPLSAEPPALLGAIADRARAGTLKDIKIYSLLPMEHAGKTVLSPELCEVIHGYTWFVSSSDRQLVKTGHDFFVPN